MTSRKKKKKKQDRKWCKILTCHEVVYHDTFSFPLITISQEEDPPLFPLSAQRKKILKLVGFPLYKAVCPWAPPKQFFRFCPGLCLKLGIMSLL
ncbi:hypothetical protein RJT34_03215 [Clitoria ternatea]|uniref:Uncharacterized protein n=1 Tax=Clitoria ternatea TaxID=43366 RepID=A0AAN9Q4V9_CLITE